ncbi:MAG: GGDEF domain-containing protein [Bacteroidales bacterium]|nr:GGDEF domain-containing protein [Bacteroidales bacterium]
MNKKKNVVVIDDRGDLTHLLGLAFIVNPTIQLIRTSSDTDELDKTLLLEDYLIIVNEEGLKADITELVKGLHVRNKFTIAPIVVATGKRYELSDDVLKLVPVISVISKDVDPSLLGHHLSNFIDSIDSNRNLNALSGLPGNNVIGRKIRDCKADDKDFAVMYIDLDNFKEYNEYYGFYKGDQVLSFLARTLYDVMRECGAETDFVGHVGGDDFIMILQHLNVVKEIGDRIIAHFDAGISNFYEAKDLENGYIETRNRAGQIERINIMSISIIVMYSDEIRSTPVNEVYKRMMLYKKRAKMVRGSVLLKDFK